MRVATVQLVLTGESRLTSSSVVGRNGGLGSSASVRLEICFVTSFSELALFNQYPFPIVISFTR